MVDRSSQGALKAVTIATVIWKARPAYRLHWIGVGGKEGRQGHS